MNRFLICAALVSALFSVLAPVATAQETPIRVADFPTPEAMAEITVPEAARLKQRLAAGIPGLLWNLPALAEGRQEALAGLAAMREESGVDLIEIYQHLSWLGLTLHTVAEFETAWGSTQQAPVVSGAAELGDAMAGLWAVLSQHLEAGEAVAGADGVLKLEANDPSAPLLARFGSRLGFASRDQTYPATVGAAGNFDLRVSWNTATILDALEQSGLMEEVAMLHEALAQAGDGHLFIQVLPDGFRELIVTTADSRGRGGRDLDRQVLDRIPADALMVLAWGIDGPAAQTSLNQALAGMDDDAREMLEMQIAVALPWEALGLSWQEVQPQLDGTTTLAILPPPMGAPFPGFSLQVPMTESLAAAVQTLVTDAGLTLPAPGSMQPIPLPIPLPLILARSETHLLVTSVSDHATTWLAGSSGGFVGSPLGQLVLSRVEGELHLLGASDTPRLLALANNLFAAFGGMMEAEPRVIITDLLTALQPRVSPGYLLACTGDFGARTENKSLIGGVFMLPMVSAMMVPGVIGARQSAQMASTANTAKQIYITIIGYRNEHGGVWPNPWRETGLPEPTSTTPEADMLVTAAIFEWLAHRFEVDHSVFGVEDGTLPRSDAAAIVAAPNPVWARRFALDWTARMSSGSMRPVLAPRQAVNGQIAVVFADGHTEFMAAEMVEETDPPRTWQAPGDPLLEVINPNTGDDLFSPETDEEREAAWGRGHRKHAWLR